VQTVRSVFKPATGLVGFGLHTSAVPDKILSVFPPRPVLVRLCGRWVCTLLLCLTGFDLRAD
jgi:hypothetical protein